MEEELRKFQRLVWLLNYLNTPAGVTVKAMADRTGVDVRTIYRDLDELRDACFDIVQDRPKGPYRLSREYNALAQTLSLEEVLCLGLSSCLLEKQLGGIGREAMRKLQGLMKGEKAEKARELPRVVQVQPGEQHEWIPLLMSAVTQRRRVRFEYARGDVPTRTLDPYTLFYQNERWYVQGFDHLRKDLRSFRLARMQQLEVLDQHFPMPAGYEASQAHFHKWDLVDRPPQQVRCRVDHELARWLEENPVHPSQQLQGEFFELQVRDLDALAHWLLGLKGVEALSPPVLRDKMLEKAQTILQCHQS